LRLRSISRALFVLLNGTHAFSQLCVRDFHLCEYGQRAGHDTMMTILIRGVFGFCRAGRSTHLP
jgi:hypothetical protein